MKLKLETRSKCSALAKEAAKVQQKQLGVFFVPCDRKIPAFLSTGLIGGNWPKWKTNSTKAKHFTTTVESLFIIMDSSPEFV